MKRRAGTLRIIGGQWRSRLVEFDAQSGVRPTPDRVRQTLFDWLAPVIAGARCLDLFAGSGALGFEALSRGAAQVQFVERDARAAEAIRTAIARLHAGDRAQLAPVEALAWLAQAPAAAFDLVFLDPPYDQGLLTPVLARLPLVLTPQHRVYLEWRTPEPVRGAAPAEPPVLPDGWRWLREKSAGQVSYGLVAGPAIEETDRA